MALVGSMTWWLSVQLNSLRTLIYAQTTEVKESILDKLEYHEKHDDERFSSFDKQLWEIRVRNAAIDGRVGRKDRYDNPTDRSRDSRSEESTERPSRV
jgi:hypothetical protein